MRISVRLHAGERGGALRMFSALPWHFLQTEQTIGRAKIVENEDITGSTLAPSVTILTPHGTLTLDGRYRIELCRQTPPFPAHLLRPSSNQEPSDYDAWCLGIWGLFAALHAHHTTARYITAQHLVAEVKTTMAGIYDLSCKVPSRGRYISASEHICSARKYAPEIRRRLRQSLEEDADGRTPSGAFDMTIILDAAATFPFAIARRIITPAPDSLLADVNMRLHRGTSKPVTNRMIPRPFLPLCVTQGEAYPPTRGIARIVWERGSRPQVFTTPKCTAAELEAISNAVASALRLFDDNERARAAIIAAGGYAINTDNIRVMAATDPAAITPSDVVKNEVAKSSGGPLSRLLLHLRSRAAREAIPWAADAYSAATALGGAWRAWPGLKFSAHLDRASLARGMEPATIPACVIFSALRELMPPTHTYT